MQIHQCTPDEALARLQTSASGLGSAEATRRLQAWGPNRLEAVAATPAWRRLLQAFDTLFSRILWVAAALAFAAAWWAPGEDTLQVGVAIVVVIVVSGLFSAWQEWRVARTLAALRRLLPPQALVLRDGLPRRIDAEALVPGDIVLLAAGDGIPADCRLIEARAVQVSQAALTGEAAPLACDAAASPAPDPADSRNILRAGTALLAGRARAVVVATGARTDFGRIARLSQDTGQTASPLHGQIAHLSRVTALMALTVGLAFFAIGWWQGMTASKALVFAIGLIVAMVPEGLLPTLTLALVLATQRMARRQVLVRHLPAVEALGAATVICTDKTGTLTEGRMAVRRLFLGSGLTTPQALAHAPARLAAEQPFFLVARLCHDLAETRGEAAGAGPAPLGGDPMERALVDLARQLCPGLPALPRLDERPFDAERMRLATLHQGPDGRLLACKGAPESVLPLCRHHLVDGQVRPLDAAARSAIAHALDDLAASGLRVLALAWRTLPAGTDANWREEDLVFAGLAGFEDPPRPEVPAALRTCRAAGIRVIMVTGDHPRTALAVARATTLVGPGPVQVLTGAQLRGLSDAALQQALRAPQLLVARVVAEQKLRIVEALKAMGEIVAVTGDGVNDAPALRSAHIGIAMGRTGTDVAQAAADMVLLDDNFASIVAAVEEGRAVFDNVRRFLTYVLVHNVAELVPCLAFVLWQVPLALTAIQVLAIDMCTDALAALGLGVERPDPGTMQRPPRPPGERLMNRPLALRAYGFLGLIEAAAAMAAFLFVLHGAGWAVGQPLAADDPLYRRATTATFSTIVLLQAVNVFLCRSAVRSLRDTGLGGNPLILWGVATELTVLLVANHTAWGQRLLGTAPLDAATWLFLLPCAVAMLGLEEARKALVRRRA